MVAGEMEFNRNYVPRSQDPGRGPRRQRDASRILLGSRFPAYDCNRETATDGATIRDAICGYGKLACRNTRHQNNWWRQGLTKRVRSHQNVHTHLGFRRPPLSAVNFRKANCASGWPFLMKS